MSDWSNEGAKSVNAGVKLGILFVAIGLLVASTQCGPKANHTPTPQPSRTSNE